MRSVIRLTLECDNRCVFCAQQGLEADDAERSVLERVNTLRSEADEVTFVGGEPLQSPELEPAVRAARESGFARIGIQTNGLRLAEPGVVDRLAEAGLTDVHLSIHGADEKVHDYHTGRPGSFARTLAALGACRARGLTVVATTVLTRSNFRALGDLPRLLHSRGVAAWMISVPHAAGRVRGAFDRVVPRLGMAIPYALHALRGGRQMGLPAWIEGAPLCVLGPYASATLPGPPRAYASCCDRCAARPRCPGVDPVYLERFGGDELTPREPPDPQAPSPETLARMFVGPGEMAPAPDPAEPLRRGTGARLPVLG